MTDFRASDPSDSTQSEQTNFATGGEADSQASNQEDTTVVLEYGGRQYTKADLLKKISNADGHINTLTSELAEQRKLLGEVNETLKRQINTAEVLKRVKEGKVEEPTPQDVPPKEENPAPNADAITTQVLAKLRAEEEAKQKAANWAHVTQTLTKVFGDKVNQRVQEVAAEAGLTVEEAAEWAKAKPKAFLRLFPEVGAKAKPSVISESGRHNTQSFQATQKASSGYHTAKTTRELISIYQARLKEAGL